MRRGLLGVFFGVLAAAVAPDLWLNPSRVFELLGTLAAVFAMFYLVGVPVKGAYRKLMVAGGVLGAAYYVGRLAASTMGDNQAVLSGTAWLVGLGAFSLLVFLTAMEAYCRERKWVRLRRGWGAAEAAVALLYAVPVVVGWLSPLYERHLGEWPQARRLYVRLAGIEFHGLHVPGGPWRPLIWLALVLPVAIVLLNLLLMYVRAATPRRPAEENEPID